METKGIVTLVKNFGDILSKNSPSLLTGVAVAGLISTTIMGIRATPKALAIIDDRVYSLYVEEIEDPDEVPFSQWLGVRNGEGYNWKDKMNVLSRKEILQLTWRVYLPTSILGIVTIVCIISANHISSRRNAALASIYGITEAAFKEYQSKVVETIGKSKELKLRDDISKDTIKRKPPGTNEVIITGRGNVLCYDTLSGRYFKSDIEKIRKTINDINYNLLTDMFVSLNDLYYALGLSSTALGDQLGWSIEKGKIEINYSSQLAEYDEPCLVLNYSVEPKFQK